MAETKEERPPEPSRQIRALSHANEVRQRRAEIKRALRSGEVKIVELLLGPPDLLQTARLSELLLAVPGYGEVRVTRLLKRCRISPLKTIGSLSQRQLDELAQMLASA